MALLFLIFGWLAKSPCIQQTVSDGTPVLDSSANRQWISGCYNDVVPAYQIYGLKEPGFPYAARTGADGAALETPPYPVLVVAFMWLTARLTNGYLGLTGGALPQPLDVAAFFTIGAILLGFLYLWAVGEHRADLPSPAVGRGDHVPVAAAGGARLHQLGPAADRTARRGTAGVGAQPTHAGRRAVGTGRVRQAVPGPAAGPAGDPRRADRSGAPGPDHRRRHRDRLGGREHPGRARVPGGLGRSSTG